MNIQFVNTNKLATQLANNEVSEKTTFSYFLANTILWTLVLYYGPATGAKFTWLTVYDLAIVLIISIIGLLKCFQANGGNDGQNFLVRATCLSFPIGLKINILSLPEGVWSSPQRRREKSPQRLSQGLLPEAARKIAFGIPIRTCKRSIGVYGFLSCFI